MAIVGMCQGMYQWVGDQRGAALATDATGLVTPLEGLLGPLLDLRKLLQHGADAD